jgi:hypothetical protein
MHTTRRSLRRSRGRRTLSVALASVMLAAGCAHPGRDRPGGPHLCCASLPTESHMEAGKPAGAADEAKCAALVPATFGIGVPFLAAVATMDIVFVFAVAAPLHYLDVLLHGQPKGAHPSDRSLWDDTYAWVSPWHGRERECETPR